MANRPACRGARAEGERCLPLMLWWINEKKSTSSRFIMVKAILPV